MLAPSRDDLFDDGPAALVAGPVFVQFELEGKPGHKGRHRSRIVVPKEAWSSDGRNRWLNQAAVKKMWIQHYPDEATEAYERILREAAGLFMRRRAPTERPLALLIHVFREVPVSWSKKDRRAALAGAILPASKPDADNHLKIVDALNGVVWKDDSQVCDARVIKRYSDRPGFRVEVREFLEPGCIS